MKVYFSVISILLIITRLDLNAAGISDATNSIYLAIGAVRDMTSITNEPIRYDDRLYWKVFCETGTIKMVCPGNAAYGMKIQLTDTNGLEIQKTTLGRRFGKKWDLLHSIYDSADNLADARPHPIFADGSLKANPMLQGGNLLPRPNELFVIDRPGIYTMEVQMQMFYKNPKSTNIYQLDLIQFSPMKIHVEK